VFAASVLMTSCPSNNTSDIFLAKGVNKNGHELVECD
jgi:hypothetical protein